MDYYNTLGVNHNAAPEDIKKAYRKLAMANHPDRTGGDDTKFKQVNEAYDTLKDPQKRGMYDHQQTSGGFEHHMRQANAQYGDNNPFAGTPFEHHFNFGFGQQARQANKDLNIAAQIQLVDVIVGKELIIQYRLGGGQVETITVEVPPGARDGDTIRYEGLGDNTITNVPRGALLVRVSIVPHKKWVRENNNLLVKKSINVFDLLLGCAIIVQTLDERKIRLVIPKGTQPGATFSITNYGIPDLHNKIRGNIYVTIETEIPQVDEIDLLTKIEELRDRTKN
jgi:curved DNA-binding protein|tara:strand:+ start:116 stop:958 length:843 start_codon:yes stop_codon:yes gene_type:complete